VDEELEGLVGGAGGELGDRGRGADGHDTSAAGDLGRSFSSGLA
jgi:hypothetical protein